MKLSAKVRNALKREPCKSRPNSLPCTRALKKALGQTPKFKQMGKIDRSHGINIRIHDLLGEREKLAKKKRKPQKRRRMRSAGEILATSRGYGIHPQQRIGSGYRPDLAVPPAGAGGGAAAGAAGGAAGGAAALAGAAGIAGVGGLGLPAGGLAASALAAPPLPAPPFVAPRRRSGTGHVSFSPSAERASASPRRPRKKSASRTPPFVEPGADSPPMFSVPTGARPPQWGVGMLAPRGTHPARSAVLGQESLAGLPSGVGLGEQEDEAKSGGGGAAAAQPKSARKHRSGSRILEEKQEKEQELMRQMDELNARPKQNATTRASYQRKKSRLAQLQSEIHQRQAAAMTGGGGAGRPSIQSLALQAEAGDILRSQVPMAQPIRPRSSLATARARAAGDDPAFPATGDDPSITLKRRPQSAVSAESPQPAMKFGRPASKQEGIGEAFAED